MDNFLKDNESTQIGLVELANEYVIELPIQQKIYDAIFELKSKRFDKKIGRWLISKDEKDKLSKTLKPITRLTVSKIGSKKYSNPEIELCITSDGERFYVEMVNFKDLVQMCQALSERLRKIESRKYDFETKLWNFSLDDKDEFYKSIKDYAKDKGINIKYNEL